MSKLHHRKFARFFPSYHPRAGEHTDFVEKIHFGLLPIIHSGWGCAQDMIYALNQNLPEELISSFIDDLDDDFDFSDSIKHHTIRAGHHVKPGDFIRPSVWGGKPYKSKQIIIGPDIEIQKVWNFDIHGGKFYINDKAAHEWPSIWLCDLAQNDGLNFQDFKDWFKFPKESFDGQIICWNKDVTY